jgi:hypothetical protein
MITALVQFKLPKPMTRDEAQQVFSTTAPRYRDLKGLVRKYYVLSEDGETAGGVYLWQTRKDAEKLYDNEWKKFIFDKYGSEPRITYFESPVIVDNLTGQIVMDE